MIITFEQVQKEIDTLQPYISSHGGAVELVKVEESTVFVKFQGACISCPLSFYTLTYGIERHLKEKISPDISVESVE